MKKRILSIAFVVVLLALAVRFGFTFPWKAMFSAVLHAAPGWVLISAVANLLSTSAKGQAWALLMGERARRHWTTAHVATLVGAATGTVAVSVGGDAVRVRWLMRRAGIPALTSLRALVASRFTEAIALAVVILVGTTFLPHSSWVTISAAFAAGLLLLSLLLWWYGRRHLHSPWPRRRFAQLLAEARAVLHQPGVFGALVFGLINWLLQWFSFGAATASVLGYSPFGFPLAVLILCNIGGALKLTPANVGVITAAALMVARPFHISATHAFAASIVMQAIQIIPTLLVGGVLLILDRRAWQRATI